VGPRASVDDVEKRKFLILPELELRPLGRPARSQSLYRLLYPGSYCNSTSIVKSISVSHYQKLFLFKSIALNIRAVHSGTLLARTDQKRKQFLYQICRYAYNHLPSVIFYEMVPQQLVNKSKEKCSIDKYYLTALMLT
jgi:hypothetical protein